VKRRLLNLFVWLVCYSSILAGIGVYFYGVIYESTPASIMGITFSIIAGGLLIFYMANGRQHD
jgi:hypothetical protein